MLICADEDADVRSCVDVLDRYLIELRRYMVKFPWPAGGDASSSSLERAQEEDAHEDEWEQLQTEVAALYVVSVSALQSVDLMFHNTMCLHNRK